MNLPSSLRPFAGHPDFLRLLGARILGGSATQMLMVALAWQMYELTGSAWDLGLVGLYQFVPVLVLTLIAGHTADRYPRSRIIAACMALQALCAAVLLGGLMIWGLQPGPLLFVEQKEFVWALIASMYLSNIAGLIPNSST